MVQCAARLGIPPQNTRKHSNMIPIYLNPKTVFRALREIDREPPSHTAAREQGSQVTLIVLFSVAAALLLLNYGKNSYALNDLLILLAKLQGLPSRHWVAALRENPFAELIYHGWWTTAHAITFVLIPYIVLKFFLKQSIVDFGWRWGDTHKHWKGYAMLLAPILVGVVVVSFRDDFRTHYPFYDNAGRSFVDLLTWECLYLTQFACLEFFFRGYMVQTLRPYYGSAAIWIMVVPYLMIHFPKPWLEATGAIFFGLFLGILALRSRSIWGGFCVHAGIAVGMDIMSLVQQNKIPTRWWPL